jgi:hypothetical protein
MGSRTFEGVRFQVYSRDHLPPHVHGFYAATLAVVELADSENVGLRPNSVKPPNAKKSDVNRIVDAAVEHYPELISLWESIHGQTRR